MIVWCLWVKSHPFLYRKTPNISINVHKFVTRVIKMINSITISTCILDFGVTSHNVIDQSMIINFEMKKISGGEAKQNPRDSTIICLIVPVAQSK
jgi:hypothetical protein